MRNRNGIPLLSVVVPAYQGAEMLPHSLGALCASDLPRTVWELIVVDDASPDTTAQVAVDYADRVVRITDGPRGPAYARNRGAEFAMGEYLVFVDADVSVHTDTLRLFLDTFRADPEIAAVFGAYDTKPPVPGLVSRYRNLLHHYVHLQGAGEAETFWAGCGAIRRDVFHQVGGFNYERYSRPQIEDIELGYRVRELGGRIVLRPEIQGTHLKRWTLWGGIITDVRDRGVPWMRLLLEHGDRRRKATLNLQPKEKIYTAFTGAATGAAVVSLLLRDVRWLVGAALLIPVLIGNLPLFRWLSRQQGRRFAIGTVPLRLLYYLLGGIAAAFGWLEYLLARGKKIALDDSAVPNRLTPHHQVSRIDKSMTESG
jgi:glycosyltransferase involved in cell wall biosynthesis